MNPFDDVVVLGKVSQETMGGVGIGSIDYILCTRQGDNCG